MTLPGNTMRNTSITRRGASVAALAFFGAALSAASLCSLGASLGAFAPWEG